MELSLKHENGLSLHFEYPSKDGLLWIVLGAVSLLTACTGFIPNSFGRVLAGLIGLLLLTVGVFTFLWRHKLQIDLQSRTYVRESGTWPFLKREIQPLSSLLGVVLTSITATGGQHYDPRPYWFISLWFQDIERLISIDESTDESDARKKLQMWSSKLQTKAVDRTSDENRMS